jgi:hypothetical protein
MIFEILKLDHGFDRSQVSCAQADLHLQSAICNVSSRLHAIPIRFRCWRSGSSHFLGFSHLSHFAARQNRRSPLIFHLFHLALWLLEPAGPIREPVATEAPVHILHILQILHIRPRKKPSKNENRAHLALLF